MYNLLFYLSTLFFIVTPVFSNGQSKDSIKWLITGTYASIQHYNDSGSITDLLISNDNFSADGSGIFKIAFDRQLPSLSSFRSEINITMGSHITFLKTTTIDYDREKDQYLFSQTGGNKIIVSDTTSLSSALAMAYGSGQFFALYVFKLLLQDQIEGSGFNNSEEFQRLSDETTPTNGECYRYGVTREAPAKEQNINLLQEKLGDHSVPSQNGFTWSITLWFRKKDLLLVRQEYSSIRGSLKDRSIIIEHHPRASF